MRGLPVKIIALLYLTVAGCAPVLSQAVLDQGDRSIAFRALQQTPQIHAGKTVILGGTIIRVIENASGPSELEVLQRPLGFRLEPELNDRTEGRFLVTREEPFDEKEFTQGRKITIAATVAGRVSRPLDETEYTYPLLRMREYHRWFGVGRVPATRFFFNFGVSASF